jgi:hypothetical protein
MMRSFRNIAVATLALSMLLVSATVAVAQVEPASVEKGGSQSCSAPAPQVRVPSRGTNVVRHYYPSGSLKHTFYNGSSLENRSTPTGVSATTWRVTSSGTLNSPGTYAMCIGQ